MIKNVLILVFCLTAVGCGGSSTTPSNSQNPLQSDVDVERELIPELYRNTAGSSFYNFSASSSRLDGPFAFNEGYDGYGPFSPVDVVDIEEGDFLFAHPYAIRFGAYGSYVGGLTNTGENLRCLENLAFSVELEDPALSPDIVVVNGSIVGGSVNLPDDDSPNRSVSSSCIAPGESVYFKVSVRRADDRFSTDVPTVKTIMLESFQSLSATKLRVGLTVEDYEIGPLLSDGFRNNSLSVSIRNSGEYDFTANAIGSIDISMVLLDQFGIPLYLEGGRLDIDITELNAGESVQIVQPEFFSLYSITRDFEEGDFAFFRGTVDSVHFFIHTGTFVGLPCSLDSFGFNSDVCDPSL